RINNNVPNNANAKQKIICCIKETLGNTSIEIKIPSFAASNVPVVVGEANLFLLRDCMIKPAILIPAPAKIIAISLGNRLIRKICTLSASPLKRSIIPISIAPINKETTDRITASIINIHSLIAILLLIIFLLIMIIIIRALTFYLLLREKSIV